ncbi:monoamine oxidase [Rivularia sp. PCC 7116]|uniref:flavin monoamine oxidase family protein n=1 Tax=Rivularia sp. PCC 7116 TaxID=373994 RepID=UPI00029F1865|nr:NAD(P)/FAD-dependent oxidoreductase [Rivularia sp. PCC 7116]AFY56413.1 monoamine oxidase [Rivularia sp. PCC 7116]
MDVKTMLHEFKFDNYQQSKRITVLGAGIAGLVAAYELERMGHQVDIMEGSPRIGGRVWTHRFGNDSSAPYGELGAMRIPSDHECVLHYINEMGLSDKLCKFVTMFEENNALLNIQGKLCRIRDVADRALQKLYQGLFLDKRYSEKTKLFAAWLKTIVNAIGSGELRECLEHDLTHLMDRLETLDLQPFLNLQGKAIDIHRFIKTHPDVREKCSKALDLFLNDILVETSPNLMQLQGGMDQLTTNLAEAINAPIRCNQEIVALRVLENGVEVSWLEEGRLYTRHCDYVLCTIPFSVLRKIELSGFDDKKIAAINNAVYWPATKVLFHCARPFWQKHGIFGGASFSDEGIRQVYYPSVSNNSSQGSVLLASYTIGDDATYLGKMSEQDRSHYVKNALSKIHPEIQTPGMLSDTATIAWSTYKWSAGGCSVPWNHDMSYERHQYQDMARSQNTLFFAGEHCSRLPAWMEGSIESALQAVHDIASYKPSVDSTMKFTSMSLGKVKTSASVPISN